MLSCGCLFHPGGGAGNPINPGRGIGLTLQVVPGLRWSVKLHWRLHETNPSYSCTKYKINIIVDPVEGFYSGLETRVVVGLTPIRRCDKAKSNCLNECVRTEKGKRETCEKEKGGWINYPQQSEREESSST